VSTRLAVTAWTLALAASAGVAATVVTSDHSSAKAWTLVLAVPTGLAFIASGLIARTRRPENRVGLLLVAAGFGSFAAALRAADEAGVYSLGHAMQWLYFGFLVHVVLAFPSGRLSDGVDRMLTVAAYGLAIVMLPVLMIFGDAHGLHCDRAPCPANVLAIASNDDVAAVLEDVHLWIALAYVVLLVLHLARRWRRSHGAARHALSPVYASFVVLVAVVAAQHVVEATSPDALPVVNWLLLGALLAVPLSFLFGLFRTRFGTAVERLLVELSTARPGTVREALARSLGDPTLELAYCVRPGLYVDAEGRSTELPAGDSGRRATIVQRDGRAIAALIHDESLAGDPLLEPVGAAAALALENERLNAELRARLEDLRASRARLVQAGDEARRRLERNLHDGAQQRLVALALALRLAKRKVKDDPAAAEELVAAAESDAASALDELRELARGLHPAILTDRGLGPALEALAARSPCPVEVAAVPSERLPTEVETAAYYVVSESLANVAKYSGADAARVSVTRRDGVAVVEISDEGVGGADIASGSGLRGLADRVEALDGRLEIESPVGRGTRVVAEIPCTGFKATAQQEPAATSGAVGEPTLHAVGR
jgi:signal transduction histidine kinase